jgi:hypothetical protein
MGRTCCFEEWDSEIKAMGHCKNPAVRSVAGHPLCKDHAGYVRMLRATTSKSMDQDALEIIDEQDG